MSAAARERLAGIGLTQWLRVGDAARVERLLGDMRQLRVGRLRTQIAWRDWHTGEGQAWYAWLLPRLAAECELLPCFELRAASDPAPSPAAMPPPDADAFVDFLDQTITRFGAYFQWLELREASGEAGARNVPPTRDETPTHAAMIVQLTQQAGQRGKRRVLGVRGPEHLRQLAGRGVLQHIDAIGVDDGWGARDRHSPRWPAAIADVRAMLTTHGLAPQVWLTGAGCATWRHDGIGPLRQLRAMLDAPVERLYWCAARELSASRGGGEQGADHDEHPRHVGLRDAQGHPTLLQRIWAADGFDGIDELASLQSPHEVPLLPTAHEPVPAPATPAATLGQLGLRSPPPLQEVARDHDGRSHAAVRSPLRTGRRGTGDPAAVLITGGAGFIGTNLAARLLAAGRSVRVFDNLARPGVEHNLRWLRGCFGERLQIEIGDVRDARRLREAVASVGQVFHFAAQVAVTSSLDDPLTDFEINLRGTLNLLEAARRARRPPAIVFTSTNKVYGAFDDLALEAADTRYQPLDPGLRATGIDESRPLDFHSPYGCSKGGADQYMLDYARSFGLAAVVLRMSCIYGPHQFGTEDQGWVAHFLIRALQRQPITFYGDGRQVRDILFVDDLVDAMLLCQQRIARLRGHAYNIGGGPANTTSLLELVERIGALGEQPEVRHAPWRTGDQRYYVSDTRAFSAATGWAPQVAMADGIVRLQRWLQAQRSDAAPSAARIHAA